MEAGTFIPFSILTPVSIRRSVGVAKLWKDGESPALAVERCNQGITPQQADWTGRRPRQFMIRGSREPGDSTEAGPEVTQPSGSVRGPTSRCPGPQPVLNFVEEHRHPFEFKAVGPGLPLHKHRQVGPQPEAMGLTFQL